MNIIKTKLLSIFAVSYLVTSNVAIANNIENDLNNEKFLDNVDVKMENDLISYQKEKPVLKSVLHDGSTFDWLVLNNFQIMGKDIPVGYNDHGLKIKSFINEENTYLENIDDVTVNSNDFPLWALSKYKDVNDLASAVNHISISSKNNFPLSYEVVDKKYNKIILDVKDGNITVS